jgi:hypothetical protein
MNSSLDINGCDSDAFDRGTDPVLRMFSVDQTQSIVDYQGDERLRARIEELAARIDDGTITAAEKSEYEGYVRANKFVAILQAQARKHLKEASRRG